MNIFITGANGYLGSTLLRLIQEGNSLDNIKHSVYGVNSHWRTTHGEVGPYFIDQALAQADVVVHLGWYSRAGNDNPELQEYSLRATKDLIYSIITRCKPTTRIIFASTASVYAGCCINGEDLWCNEVCTPVSTCSYTLHKLEAERMIRNAFPTRHLILRLGSLMGRGFMRTKTDLVVNAFALDGYREGKIKVWNPHSWKPVIHVRDVSEIIINAIERPRFPCPPTEPNPYDLEWSGTLNVAEGSYRASSLAHRAGCITGARVEDVGVVEPIRSVRLDTSALKRMLPPRIQLRGVEETMREFEGYQPQPNDRNTPWVV